MKHAQNEIDMTRKLDKTKLERKEQELKDENVKKYSEKKTKTPD
jgi:hypothetical protein